MSPSAYPNAATVHCRSGSIDRREPARLSCDRVWAVNPENAPSADPLPGVDAVFVPRRHGAKRQRPGGRGGVSYAWDERNQDPGPYPSGRSD